MKIVNLFCIISCWIYPAISVSVRKSDLIIRCFDCTFDLKNSHCDDQFNTLGIKVSNCTGSCVKVKMHNDGKAGKVYGRYCSSYKMQEQCRVTDSGKGQRMEECYCNRDLCNTASYVIGSSYNLTVWSIILYTICMLHILE